MSFFVLDLGGSREIGLCPHSRIYPETKLATPLGNYPFCLFGFLNFLWPFSLVTFFSWFVNLWVLRIPWVTFWVQKSVWFLLDFSNFSLVSGIPALCPLAACENLDSSHLAYIFQCELFAFCITMACENHCFSHCVTHWPANIFLKFFEFQFWLLQ